MSKSLSLKQQQLDETNIEIRKTILPKLNQLITTATNNIVNNITMHVIDISGKTLPEVEQMITNLKYQTSCEISDEIRDELAKLLFSIVHPGAAVQQMHEDAADEISQEQHVHQAAESNHTGLEIEPDITEPAEQQPAVPNLELSTEPMPLSTVRSIILDRVDDDVIERIIHLNAQGMSIAQMRTKGIKLADQVIETIIEDYATTDTGDPIEPPNYDDKTIRQVRKLYKNGHTVEYVASRTKTSIDDINVIIEDINPLDISPNYATLAIVQAHKAANKTVERTAELCGLRVDAVKLSLNGSQ